MSTDLTPSDGQSPFDAIRRVRPDGSEFWTARDLMPLLGYDRWENFSRCVNEARNAATIVDAVDQFRDVAKMIETGKGARRSIDDVEMTRYGAYMVAMSCDGRKREVAEAKTYFAVRAREAEIAEVTPRQQAELLTKADLARMVLESEEEKAVLAAALESAAPMVAYHDRYISNDDAVLVEVWGAQFGLTRPQAFDLLVEHGLIYKRLIMKRYSEKKHRIVEEYEYRAYARYLDWFDLRPQHDAPRHHNGQVRQTLYVRQQFALDIADKLGVKA
jgi:DNA-damage-inducible protein D